MRSSAASSPGAKGLAWRTSRWSWPGSISSTFKPPPNTRTTPFTRPRVPTCRPPTCGTMSGCCGASLPGSTVSPSQRKHSIQAEGPKSPLKDAGDPHRSRHTPRIVRPFQAEGHVLAVGGTIRVVNVCLVRGRRVIATRVPRRHGQRRVGSGLETNSDPNTAAKSPTKGAPAVSSWVKNFILPPLVYPSPNSSRRFYSSSGCPRPIVDSRGSGFYSQCVHTRFVLYE